MKIISWNVNGIRSVYKKGFLDWFKKENPDILCLQEIKSQENQIPRELTKLKKYHLFFNTASKKGYSGVLVFTKEKPLQVEYNLGLKRFDEEGRFLKLEFDNFILINLYFPHGGRNKENLEYKLKVYSGFLDYLKKINNKKVILIGDFNIAHKEIDLARPKQNKNNIMFTEREREQIDKIIEIGFIDIFRKLNFEKIRYTWWPYFANARKRNLGWRIDYTFISENFFPKIKKAEILSKIKGSDHCPISIELK